jgi:hypothetical protein
MAHALLRIGIVLGNEERLFALSENNVIDCVDNIIIHKESIII